MLEDLHRLLRGFLQKGASMRALWSDRQNCSHNVSQKVKRIRHLSDKKPFTRVSQRVMGAHGKRSLERGWQKRLAKSWRKVGERLAQSWRRLSLHHQLCNSRNSCLEEQVCDSMVLTHSLRKSHTVIFEIITSLIP